MDVGQEKQGQNKRKGNPTWVKGVSGNPKGRPRKEQTLQHWIDELGDEVPKAVVNGKDNTLPRAALVVMALYTQAIKGNVQAINTILDRKLGKVKQDLSVEHYEKPLESMTDDELEQIAQKGKE